MNIDQSKQIKIEDVIAVQGHGDNFAYEKKQGRELWYRSPFRNEDTPSFKINTEQNTFYDFGEGKGGDTLNYVCMYYNEGVKEGLQRLKDFFGGKLPKIENKPPTRKKSAYKPRFEIKKTKKITNPSLFTYLDSRGIHREVGRNYLKEVEYLDTEKKNKLYGLGLQNMAGGWEVKNQYYNTAIGRKDIAIISGGRGVNHALHVFEGWSDALTFLTISYPSTPTGDIMILNTASLIHKGMKLAQGKEYPKIVLWLDNDETGLNATQEALQYHDNIIVMNYLYEGFKDLNKWHENNLNTGQKSVIFQEAKAPDESIGWAGNKSTPEAREKFLKDRAEAKEKKTNEPFGMSDSKMIAKMKKGRTPKPKKP